MRPLLPSVDKLLPYLKRIDENRYYTNVGPLCLEYEKRISELFECPCITGSSATLLITATLMAMNLSKGSLVAMPSWTFPATAAAVVAAGMVPYFVDVDEGGVMPINECGLPVSAAILVVPFGKPIKWNEDFDVPLIVDAAAGFDAFSTVCKPLRAPVIISTHATKAFGTGEGGLLFWRDRNMLDRVRYVTNFGISPDRRIEYNGLNAKFSEYHAAVGLAELDGWPDKRSRLLEAVKPYGLDYAITQIPVRGQGVMGRYGCHQHKAYSGYPRTALPVTEDLIANVGMVAVDI